MFSILNGNNHLCDGLTRREMIRAGGIGAFGLSLPNLVHASEASSVETVGGSFGRAKRCIVLFLLGGPPQHETWDPKPDAPSEVRGDFSPIESATPGLRVGELMPRTAKLTDRIGVLRAVSTADNAHSSSGYWMLTGYPHAPKNKENAVHGPPNDWPCVGAVVRHLRGDTASLPGSVRLPEEIWNTGRIVWPGQDAGWLGHSADPWLLDCDPNKADFKIPDLSLPNDIPALRFDRRKSLLASVNGHLDAVQRDHSIDRWSGLQHKAFDLLSSSDARKAFDIQAEADSTRERYGRNRFGQSVLLARRLVEAGVSLVQVNWTRWEEDQAVAPAWDNHADNSKRLKSVLMPPMDMAYSALLEDLEQRGMLDDTLVVWIGEFGRTPKINARAGRDHWGHVFSAALAGGGIQGGTVHGASDSQGAYPASGRVEPQDITATIFHCLGYRPGTEIHDRLGRPMAISKGNPIGEILQS